MCESKLDNIDRLRKIKDDLKSKDCSEIVFLDGVLLDSKTESSLLVDHYSLCKTVENIAIYNNDLGKFVDILTLNPLGRDLPKKLSLVPNIANLK